jgi:hypothetical protein
MIVTTPDNPSPATTSDQLAKVAALTATAIAGLASAGTASGGLSKLYRNHPVWEVVALALAMVAVGLAAVSVIPDNKHEQRRRGAIIGSSCCSCSRW